MNIALSGNPFVDTGLGVIAALCGLGDVTALTLENVREIFGDGSQLAEWNSRLKTFTQVFGTNGPLFQKGYGYKKGVGPGEKNVAIYRNTLRAFLDAIPAVSKGPPCEACGAPTDFDFPRACSRVIEAAETKAPEEKWVGRDWFPLSGSLGSDAQALPGASRTVHLCPKCLFAVHYLPLAPISLDGRLAVFQSTSVQFWYDFLRTIVDGAKSRLSLKQFDTLGTKEGSRAVSRRLMAYFNHLRDAGLLGDVSPETTLLVWRFTNSGASPDCQIEEIPNAALRFMSNAARSGLHLDVERLIASEDKRGGLLRCISERRACPGLYPRGNHGGAGPRLFVLYQTEVCGRPARVLSLAHTLACQAAGEIKETELSRLRRPEAFRAPAARNRFRRLMSELARQNHFTLDDYLLLFPSNDDERGIGVRSDGWDIIRYYLHHIDDQDVTFGNFDLGKAVGVRREMVTYYARLIFNAYVDARGVGRFESDILQPAGMGRLGTAWLQRQFTCLAEQFPGFTYAAWEALCLNDTGHSCLSELLFQMRLLWAEWLSKGTGPSDGISVGQEGSGLAKRVEEALASVFTGYVQQRGVARFRRDVLMRLQQRTIGLGWLRRQLVDHRGREDELLTMSESGWEELLNDDGGRRAPMTRLFQMHLYLVNVYRDMMQSEAMVDESIEEEAR